MELSEIKTREDIIIWLKEDEFKKMRLKRLMMFDDLCNIPFRRMW